MLFVKSQKASIQYDLNANIAVKTSRGLIKLNQFTLSKELSKLHAELSRHNSTRTTKYKLQIDELIDDLNTLIRRNPTVDLSTGDERGDIIERVMSDAITHDQQIQQTNYNTILSHDDLEHGTDSDRFDYLLKHIDILQHMTGSSICYDGVCDLIGLENLLRMLDLDLSNSTTGNYETPIGQEIKNHNDPMIIPRLSLFYSKNTQLEGMSVESVLRSKPRTAELQPNHMIVGAQNARNAQQRSQMFESNRRTLGNKTNYMDDDLLQLMHD